MSNGELELSGPAMKPCPYCAEEIIATAIKCKHCKSAIASSPSAVAAPTALVPSPSSGTSAPSFAIAAGAAAAPQPAFALATNRAPLTVANGPGTALLLSVVTLGIYGLVEFYRIGKEYEAGSRRKSPFRMLFWWYLGLTLGSLVTWEIGIGFLAFAAGVVFGALVLNEAIKLRLEYRDAVKSKVELWSSPVHVILWLAGFVFVIPWLIQGYVFFDEHRKLAQESRV